MDKKKVVICMLGTSLDSGLKESRWDKWRPTVAVSQIPAFPVDRLELIFNGPHDELASMIAKDIDKASPATTVIKHRLPINDVWNLEDVSTALFSFAKSYVFDLEREEYFIHITTGSHIVQICLFSLVKSNYLPGKLLQTAPPRRKGDPAQFDVIDLDLSRYDQLTEMFSLEKTEGTTFLKSGIATKNVRFNAMIDEVEKVAIKSSSPILLMGPTGAGKSYLASRIYDLKKGRRQISGKFIEINCKTLRGDGAMSTLFGHVRGAFTGAADKRAGLLKAADKGIIFLDEIGEMPLDDQAMLLKAIEEKRFFPVGSDVEVESDFQLIAGTNLDLAREVAAGRFREDLFARINHWIYDLPGLAKRIEDIEPTMDYLLAKACQEQGSVARFNKEARAMFLSFAKSSEATWNGNFRDLSACVSRMVTLAPSGRITEIIVSDEIVRLKKLWGASKSQRDVFVGDVDDDDVDLVALLGEERVGQIDLFDLSQLRTVCVACKGSRSMADAGRKLFAQSRKPGMNDSDRLMKYLGRFGIKYSQIM
jgi:transcriptional regulatory protein RtcR